MDAAQIERDNLAIVYFADFILLKLDQLVDFFILVRQSLQFEVFVEMVVIEDVVDLFHSDFMELLHFLLLYDFDFILRCFGFVFNRQCFFAAYLRPDNFCSLLSLSVLFDQFLHVIVSSLLGLFTCQLLYDLLLLFDAHSLKCTNAFLTSALLETGIFLLFAFTLLLFLQHLKKLLFTIFVDLNFLSFDFLLLLFEFFLSLCYQK